MKKAIFAIGLCGLAFFVWLVFFRVSGQTYLSQEPKQVRQEILKLVPLGSDITQAKTVMESNGFVCTWEKNEQFATLPKGQQMIHRKADFLYCDREQGWITHERWQVAIVHKNGRVTEVHVSYGIIGL